MADGIEALLKNGMSLADARAQVGREQGWGDQYLYGPGGSIVDPTTNLTYIDNGDGTYKTYDNDPAANDSPAAYNGRTYQLVDNTGKNIGSGKLSGYKNGDMFSDYGPFAMLLAGMAPAVVAAGAAGAGASAVNGFDSGAMQALIDSAPGAATEAATSAASTIAPEVAANGSWDVLPEATTNAANTAATTTAASQTAGPIADKAWLDGTTRLGANAIDGALDTSALSSATTSAGANAAVLNMAKDLGYSQSFLPWIADKLGIDVSTLRDAGSLGGVLNAGKSLLGLGGDGNSGGLGSLLPLLLLLGLATSRSGGTAASKGMPIPKYSGGARVAMPGSNNPRVPGAAAPVYFQPMNMQKMAAGGLADIASTQSRLLRGPGDGVSDSIHTQLDDGTPLHVARGEYVVDARTVSELGNGSTDAGAEKLDAMVKRVHAARSKAKIGKDSGAERHMPA